MNTIFKEETINKGDKMETIIPAPIVYATAISIIVIALAILIWLVLTILFGTFLLKKINDLTKNVSKLTETWNEKSKQIADQTTATILSFQAKPKSENESGKKNYFTSTMSSIIGLSPLIFDVIKMVNKNKTRKGE